jgi:transcriptional regulator with PAS, ATPase and Fis domain
MYHRKMIRQQLTEAGLRIGDSCSIYPFQGRKKSFTLNRTCLDIVSRSYRPTGLAPAYVELPHFAAGNFHYRLELEAGLKEQRFILKTMEGGAFWLNGLAAIEAYVERNDRLFIEDNKINFDGCNLLELTQRSFDHSLLLQDNLVQSNLNILIIGETGTGKTDLARKIHERSHKPGPFVAINLSSFNPQLIESELFGHKKGSFTGAIADRDGAFTLSNGGTLFLDEIDSLPLELQTKLLSFLDQKKFRPVGSSKEESIRARLIFASGRKLETLVDQGLFRRDFYFRLKSGHSVELSPLRNNVLRIREACQHFCLREKMILTERLMEFYETLAWPGNLRQLFGHLEKKKILTRGIKLDFDSSDEELLLQSTNLSELPVQGELMTMEEQKLSHLRRVLSICEGNVAMTARKLNLSEKTVRTLMVKI